MISEIIDERISEGPRKFFDRILKEMSQWIPEEDNNAISRGIFEQLLRNSLDELLEKISWELSRWICKVMCERISRGIPVRNLSRSANRNFRKYCYKKIIEFMKESLENLWNEYSEELLENNLGRNFLKHFSKKFLKKFLVKLKKINFLRNWYQVWM